LIISAALTMSQRVAFKQMLAAGEATGTGDDDIARATGLSPEEMNALRAANAAKPVSLDERPPDAFADPGATGGLEVAELVTVEAEAAVNAITTAAADCIEAMPQDQQAVLVLYYYADIDNLERIAEVLGIEPGHAGKLRAEGITVVRIAMLLQVTGAR
jgi:DNA-directed RNA polymerase specialized sigma subunit